MLPPFDGNGYRKRVLAAIERRGGPDATDPFEVYDLPLEAAGSLTDDEVARRVDDVWAFWQKQRDHPKYRGLVTALLRSHDALAAQLRTPGGRQWLAGQTRAERERREAARFAALDAALERLVERFGGVPADKVAGLRGMAAAAGLDDAAFEARLRGHRLLGAEAPAAPAEPADAAVVLRQVRDGLEELGRIEGARVPSLHALLELPPTADRETVRRRRDALLVVNRQRRPDRRRALVDDLLAAAGTLLVDGDPAVYLDALADDVRAALRPRVTAAVLVEDRLTPADAYLLLQEAQAAGLDPQRAAAVVTGLAREAGAMGDVPAPPPARVPGRADWQAEVSAARAALRDGRPAAARRHADAALSAAGELLPPIRAVRDEAAEVAARAGAAWRGVGPAVAARRPAAAAAAREQLVATAADVPGPGGEDAAELLRRSREALALADAVLAPACTGRDREDALLAALDAVADHPAARAELAALGVAPATDVVVAPAPGGAREVRWTASASPGPVEYRVLRVRPDGTRQVVGTTTVTTLEDGGYGEVAGYVVVASRLGVAAPEARGGDARPRPPAASLPPVTGVVLRGDRLRWDWPPGCTEVVVVLRPDAPPVGPDDPAGTRRKVTNSRYEIDGGLPVPAAPGHVAVFPATRVDGRLVVSDEGARLPPA
ncbi:hypothetical protein GCM10027261_44750 [Geodermatophilus arenarius]